MKKKTPPQAVSFSIKRKTSVSRSAQEHAISEDVKAFRKVAPKMDPGDSFECNSQQRHRIFNFLRYRNLQANFKSRIISPANNTVAVYCIKKTTKGQLI